MSDESFLFIAQKTIPIIAHKITKLRDASTKPKQFRELIGEIATLLSYEATRTLETEKKLVSTPMGETTGERIKTTVGLVPILRAGLGMLEGALNLLPFAKVFHIGLYRDEETLQPVHYYNKMKLETISNTDLCIILDPMLATGGSINATIDSLREKGAKKIIVIAILGAPEGVANVHKENPNVPIYLGALDSNLNDIGYIVPGLGDAGDRQFGTL